MAEQELADRLGHVRWLGGGSGAGKSELVADEATALGLPVIRIEIGMPVDEVAAQVRAALAE